MTKELILKYLKAYKHLDFNVHFDERIRIGIRSFIRDTFKVNVYQNTEKLFDENFEDWDVAYSKYNQLIAEYMEKEIAKKENA